MRIALLGDIALFGSFSKTKNQFLEQKLREVSDYLSTFDYVVGNLEAPFSSAKKTYGAKSAYICSDPECIETLKQLHVKAVTVANNHMFDYGVEGYELTKSLLKEAGIKWFGAEGKELRLEVNGSKIVFAGFCCYTSNPLKCVRYGGYGVNAYNLSKAKVFIKHSQEDGFLPILAVHAGLEHVNYPSLEHVRAARLLSDVGNYIYYGHHPHVIQGVEEYNGSLIAHSLGNFCFDDVYTNSSSDKPLVELSDNNRKGMILELAVEGNHLIDWKEQIIYIGHKGNIILKESDQSITNYNNSLIHCLDNESCYNERRFQLLSARISERKAQRNIMWYLRRIRLRYVIIILNARKNAKLYKLNVLKYLNYERNKRKNL